MLLAIDQKKAKSTAESRPKKFKYSNQNAGPLPTGRLANLGG